MFRTARYEIAGQSRSAQQRYAQCTGSGRWNEEKEITNWHFEFCTLSAGATYGTRVKAHNYIRLCQRNRSVGRSNSLAVIFPLRIGQQTREKIARRTKTRDSHY